MQYCSTIMRAAKIVLFDMLILTILTIDDALCDLVPFAQFKKREKHPWTSVTFSKVAGF